MSWLLFMDAPVREEISGMLEGAIQRLQFRGDGYRDGEVFRTFGIVYVPDPYEARQEQQKKQVTLLGPPKQPLGRTCTIHDHTDSEGGQAVSLRYLAPERTFACRATTAPATLAGEPHGLLSSEPDLLNSESGQGPSPRSVRNRPTGRYVQCTTLPVPCHRIIWPN